MPSWWGKSSSKEVKRKANRESILDTKLQKSKNASEEKCNDKPREIKEVKRKANRESILDTIQQKSKNASEVKSEKPHARPFPFPCFHLPTVGDTNSGISLASKLERARGSKPSNFPLPKPVYISNNGEPKDEEGDIAAASVYSDSSINSGDSSDLRLVSTLASDCENGYRATINNSSSVVHKDQSPITIQRNSRASSKPAPLHLQNLQIARPGGLCSAPDSSKSSPSRNRMRACGPEQAVNSGFWTAKPYPDIASGHCYSPGSGHNSGQNSVGGDLSGQTFQPQNRCSAECSPIPSPRMTSPGPGSRIHSGDVSPLHPRAGVAAAELPTRRPDNVKQQTHRLPLPPITVNNCCPFSPTASTTPSAPHSPASAENPTSPGSRWKKGQLLGRGTFGHVYLGFNRESGEMCAMKEVTLVSDDAKSRECAQQLGQEIALLSQLRHPNIVQYYGSELIDDKLYIYLEYVSGGSIYKLVQEYGQLGEIAIRNYTRQILSGLAYLHAKNTVHRDIKGANILVDPNGWIKLADFGMAKHISGKPCPFSFKGSPYWMAPEVLKNPEGCNLAVDIWSLGCTVLEMATTKPPWSQYEGVAAMFKIGNTKELPKIPDHLSEDGKDFVRLCLQRNPLNRPSAAQLLEHPFVKNVTLERTILTADPLEAPPAVLNALRSLVQAIDAIGPAKHNLCLDSEVAGIYPPRSLRTGSGSSDAHTPRNIPCPFSPSGTPHLPSRPLHASGRMSPSPIASPRGASGSSTLLTSGGDAIPFHQTKQPSSSCEAVSMIQKSQNGFYSNGSTAYQGSKHDQFRRNRRGTHACRDVISSHNDARASHTVRAVQGGPREIHDKKSNLADCLSHQVLRDYTSRDLKPGAPMLGRTNGI